MLGSTLNALHALSHRLHMSCVPLLFPYSILGLYHSCNTVKNMKLFCYIGLFK